MGRTSARDFVEALLLDVHHAQYLQQHPHVKRRRVAPAGPAPGGRREDASQKHGPKNLLAASAQGGAGIEPGGFAQRIKTDWIEPETLFWAAWKVLPAGERPRSPARWSADFVERVEQAASVDPRPESRRTTRWSGTATASTRCCGRRWSRSVERRSARMSRAGSSSAGRRVARRTWAAGRLSPSPKRRAMDS